MIIGVFGADDNGAVQEIFGEEIWVPNEKTPGFADRSESNKRFWNLGAAMTVSSPTALQEHRLTLLSFVKRTHANGGLLS